VAELGLGGIDIPFEDTEAATRAALGLDQPATDTEPEELSLLLPSPAVPANEALSGILEAAAETTPQETAADLALSKALGITVEDITGDNREEFKKKKIRDDLIDNTEGASVTQGYVQLDETLAKLLAGDPDNVRQGEIATQKLTFSGALSNGVTVMKSLGYRFIEAVGEVVSEDVEAFAQAKAEALEAQLGQRGVKQSFQDIWSGDETVVAGKLWDWMRQTAGEVLPLMAPSLAGGAAGFGIGLAVGGPAAPATAIVGSMIGAFIPSLILGTGETQGSIKQRDASVEAPGVAFIGGIIIGALDTALIGKLGSLATKAVGRKAAGDMFTKIAFKTMALNAAAQGTQGLTVEALTEGLQFVVSETFAASATDTEIDPVAFTHELIENMAAGALMGLGATSVTSVGTDIVKSRRVKRAMDESNRLEKVGQLKTLSAEKAAELKVGQMQAAGVEEVFVPVEVLMQYAGTQADPVAALETLGVPLTTENLAELRDLVGTTKIAISLEKFAEHLHGTEAYDMIAPHLTVERDAKSLAESIEIAFKDDETIAEYQAQLEDYEASVETKAKVAAVINKVAVEPKDGHKIIEEAGHEIEVILDTLIQIVQDRKGAFASLTDVARTAQLDEDLAKADQEIVVLQEALEKRVEEGRATKTAQKRLDAKIKARDKLVEEQTEIDQRKLVVGIGPTVQEEADEAAVAGVRKKFVKLKGKVLEDIGVKIKKQDVRNVRTAFKAGLRAGQNLIKAQKTLVKGIKNLPGLNKANILTLSDMIHKAETLAQLDTALSKVKIKAAVMVEQNRRKQIKAAIKKVVTGTQAKGKKQPKGNFTSKVQEFLDEARITLRVSPDPDTKKLKEKKTLELLYEDSIAVGEKETLPDPDIAFQRQLLAIGADLDVNTTDLENVLIDLNRIIEAGRAANLDIIHKLRAKKNKQVAANSQAVTRGEPTEEITTVGFFKQLKARGQSLVTSLGSMHNGWDEILDINFNKEGADPTITVEPLRMTHEIQEYKGRVHRWEQELQQIEMDSYGITGHSNLEDKRSRDADRIPFGSQPIGDGSKTRVLEYSRAELRKLWMEHQDPTLTETIEGEQSMGFNEEVRKTLFDGNGVQNYDGLTDQDKAFALAEIEFYKRMYKPVNVVYRQRFGVNLPFNEFYSPIQRDQSISRDGGKDTFGTDLAFVHEPKFRRSIAKSTIKRVPNTIPLMRRSDIGAMHAYMHEAAWFIETSEKVLFLKSVFKSETLRADIAAHHGDNMKQLIDGFLEDFGSGYPARSLVPEKLLGTVNRRFAGSVLALKGTIGTKQLVSWFAMADNIPTAHFLASHIEFFKSPGSAKKITKFLFESSVPVEVRGSSLDFELAKSGAMNRPFFSGRALKIKGFKITPNARQWEEFKFALIKFGDRVPIYAGGWAVYTNKLQELSGQKFKNFAAVEAYSKAHPRHHKESIKVFNDAFNTTQQSTDIDKQSAVQRMGAIGKTLTMFMTARMSLMRAEIRAIRQFKRGKITAYDFGKRMAVYHFVMPMMIQYIASGFEWEEDRQAVAALLGQMNSFVIFGDLMMTAAESVFTDEAQFPRGEELVLPDLLREMWKGVNDAVESGGDLDELLDAMVEIAGVIGTLTGQPIDQVTKIIKGSAKVVDGDVEEGMKLIWGHSEKVAEKSSK
jgi:hypothetical protein